MAQQAGVEGIPNSQWRYAPKSMCGVQSRLSSVQRCGTGSIEHPGAASEGCIIVARPIREQVWESGDRKLQVIA